MAYARFKRKLHYNLWWCYFQPTDSPVKLLEILSLFMVTFKEWAGYDGLSMAFNAKFTCFRKTSETTHL